ncbi:MAG: site-2 protease family protein [Candidatus Levyibacteriota bacterium]
MDFNIGTIIWLIVLIFSAILHEVAHGWLADRFGDPTARLSGRLTLNPRSHIDLFMTILLPLMLIVSHSPVIFGGAKPVPVDPYNLKEGRKDLALVALAGPLVNILLAIFAALSIKGIAFLFPFLPVNTFSIIIVNMINNLLFIIAQVNVLLAIFNLLPIPPLDGSKVFSLLLPEREAAMYLSLSQFGVFILLFLLVFPIFGFSLENLIFNLFNLSLTLLGLK